MDSAAPAAAPAPAAARGAACTAVTPARCWSNTDAVVPIRGPSRRDHTRTVRSLLPESTCRPSTARSVMSPPWPRQAARSAPERALQIFTRRSSAPVTKCRPQGEKQAQ